MITGILCFNKASGDHILNTAKELLTWAKKKKIPIFFQPTFSDKSFPRMAFNKSALSQTNVGVSLGGDGTFLAMARLLHDTDHTLVGVNLGSFGFLTEISASEMTASLDKLHQGKATFHTHPFMHVAINGSKKKEVFYGINDAVITKAALSRIIKVDVRIDGQPIGCIHGDGVIVSTPLGSTAYSLAAGGPIVYPKLEAFAITPICPHTLTYRPIISPMNKMIELEVTPENRSDVFLSLDGQEGHVIAPGTRVTIRKDKRVLTVLANPNRSYWDVVRTKLKLGHR